MSKGATAAGKLCLVGCVVIHAVQHSGCFLCWLRVNQCTSTIWHADQECSFEFSSALYSALSSGTVCGDKPVNGAFAILCINLSHTPNEQVKFRVINGTVHHLSLI